MSESRVLEALHEAEPVEAYAALEQLTRTLGTPGVRGIPPETLWDAFKELLHRRGYYVATPAEIATSLDEIEAVGEGFDLYDLARALSRYDTLHSLCLHRASRCAIPELKRFSPACTCGKHRKEK